MLQDLRFATRALLRRPILSGIAVLTLALGVGANSALFSVVQAVLAPLPFERPAELMALWKVNLEEGSLRDDLPYPNVRDLRERSQTLADVAAFANGNPTYSWLYNGEPIVLTAMAVSHGYFDLLGVEPLIGRGFRPEEDQVSAPRVVLLGNRFWRERLSGDPDILSQQIVLNGESHTVLGVLPPGYLYPEINSEEIDLWLPLEPWLGSEVDNRGISLASALARLAPGVTMVQAQAELDRQAEQLRLEHPTFNRQIGLKLRPLTEVLLGDVRPALLLLLGAVGLVLLVACANVASLLLAAAAARRGELAMRRALGGSSGRLMRAALAEGLVLAVVGGGLGLAAAYAGMGVLRSSLPVDLPRATESGIDLGVLAFAAGACFLASLLISLLPAFYAMRVEPVKLGRESGGRGRTEGPGSGMLGGLLGGWHRGGLVAAQIAIGFVVLSGGAILLAGFQKLAAIDPGFDASGKTMMFSLMPSATQYPDFAAQVELHQQIIERLQALPGVEAAGIYLQRPLHGPVGFDLYMSVEGQTFEEFQRNPLFNYQTVTPGFFPAMDIRLFDGRMWSEYEGEQDGRPVLISRSVADRYWPNESALGKRLKWGRPDNQRPWLNVIGVVENVRHRSLTSTSPDVYEPFPTNIFAPWTPGLEYAVRAYDDPMQLRRQIREVVQEFEAQLPLTDIQTTSELLDGELAQARFQMLLMLLFGALALVLAAVGLYGLSAYDVTRRQRELGIRLALGASQERVLRGVLARGLRLTVIGLVLGLGTVLALGRWLQSKLPFLSGIDLLEPRRLVTCAFILAAIALLACLRPALRAAAVDPALSIRAD